MHQDNDAIEALVRCGRRCCLCHKFCGNRMEIHHIRPKAQGGEDNFENYIPLCFDCHEEVGSYNPKHPKGRRFTEEELRRHRDQWYRTIETAKVVVTNSVIERSFEKESLNGAGRLIGPRNAHFTGHEELLSRLRSSLDSSPGTVHALVGMAGLGKTQIAREYAFRHSDRYSLTLWLNAENRVELATSFIRHFNFLAPQPSLKPPDVMEFGMQWLFRNRGWLLILDNAEDPGSYSPILSLSGQGHILITSQNRAWDRIGKAIPVPPLSVEEGGRLLCSRTGQADSASAERLVALLGGLPLAITQAACVIRGSGLSFQEYIRQFQEHPVTLLSEGIPEHYPHSLTRALRLSIGKVKLDPVAGLLLTVISFVSPDQLSALHLETWMQSPSQNRILKLLFRALGSFPLRDALNVLQERSILEAKGELLSVHRLIQETVREELSMRAKRSIIVWLTQLLAAHYDVEWHGFGWTTLERLTPHIVALTENARKHNAVTHLTIRVLGYVSRFHKVLGKYDDALRNSSYALDLVALLKQHHPLTEGIALSTVADNLAVLGLYSEAIQKYRQAIAMTRKWRRSWMSPEGMSLVGLGRIALDIEDWRAALKASEAAAPVLQLIPGCKKCTLGQTNQISGAAYAGLGRLSEAEAELVRAVELSQETHGSRPCHYYALSLACLSGVYMLQGRWTEARHYHDQSINMGEDIYGALHPLVARLKYQRYTHLINAGLRQEAVEVFRQAIAADPNLYGFVNFSSIRAVLDHKELLVHELGEELLSKYLDKGSKLLAVPIDSISHN